MKTNQDFIQLYDEFLQQANYFSLSPLMQHVQVIWDHILQKAILFYQDNTLFSQFIHNDIKDSQERTLWLQFISKLNSNDIYHYEWDQLLFPRDDKPHSLLQALIDYEQLTKEEEIFVSQILHSKLGIYEIIDYQLDNGIVILEDIFLSQQYLVYDELLLLDVCTGIHSKYLFTRLLPIQNHWIMTPLEVYIDSATIQALKKSSLQLNTQTCDQLWKTLHP